MRKERISPVANLMHDTEALKESFKTTNELPTPETVVKTVANVLSEMQQTKEQPQRNQRKRETIKGTILQSVMMEVDLLKKVKREAFETEMSLSDVINNALKKHFQ
jgi:hypothetical protein